MSFGDVLEATFFVALGVFLLLVSVSVVRLRWRGYRGSGWRVKLSTLARYSLVRGVIAVIAAGSFFIVITAGLTLNTHRPPGDTNPVVKVRSTTDPITLRLSVDECGEPVHGSITIHGRNRNDRLAGIYTDQTGVRKIALDDRGRGDFRLSDATHKNGLLSCYLQTPTVSGRHGPVALKIALGEDQQIDTTASIPSPAGYNRGLWLWSCGSNRSCPGLAVFGAAYEPGAKQVITLILAAIFGAIIAVLIADTLLEPIRHRLTRGNDSKSG